MDIFRWHLLSCAMVLAVVLNAWTVFADASGHIEGKVLNFEQGAAGWKLKPGYSVVKGEGMNGSAALVYENHDPKIPYVFPYSLPTFDLMLKTGVYYRVSAMIRTENLDPAKGHGVRLCLTGVRTNGTWTGEAYSDIVRGTTGWKKVEFMMNPVRPDAVTCRLAVFCRPRSVGKACFDDIRIEPVIKPAVGGIASSAYRNTAAEGRVDFRVGLSVPEKYALDEMKGVYSYEGTNGVRVTGAAVISARDRAGFSIDAAAMKRGSSEIAFELFAPDGVKLGGSSLRFNHPSAMPSRRVWIDRHGRTIVDGKPFFPLGMYTTKLLRKETFVKGPFNTVMSYTPPDAVQMDFFHTNGIKVIYSVKDAYAAMGSRAPECVTTVAAENAYVQAKIEAFKNHPALLAWYVNDECTFEMFGSLEGRQRLLERLDPDHPTWAVLYQLELLRDMMPTFDIIGSDPYPVPDSPLSRVTAVTRRTHDAMFGLRPMWQVPQAFDWGVFRKPQPGAPAPHMPSVDEMRSMSWQFVAAGANGLIYYSFSTIQLPKRRDGTPTVPFEKAWGDICVVGAELKKYLPVLLSEPGPPVTGAPTAWGVRTWRKDGETWLLLVNAQDKADTAEVALPGDTQTIEVAFGPMAEKTGARTARFSLAPNQPALYRVK